MQQTKNIFSRRCRILGGPVSFKYCETCETNSLPCHKIIECWGETFNVKKYLKDSLSEENFNKLINFKPESKISKLVEIAKKASEKTLGS